VLYMVVLMFLGQGIVKIKWKLEGTCFNIPVSIQIVTKSSFFEYPHGRIREGLFRVFYRSLF
jgi:hypothetical protein